ncbi:hypothetical protein [Azotobacter chroococcum]|uniref:hypothetical protein n=1 Tax=Azotobacter chroococcum TaxID=353 RepID=UPI0010AEC72D|nr:hypothetical protein [Azotobacter chroococcum]TKD46041.1 hypothetical protein FCG41_02855 [Azotobacter chroococcum]
MSIDLQSAIVAELLARLADVPEFGELVIEDSVLRILDAEDETLPDDLIVVQPGQTEEVERIGQGSVRERVTLNVTLMTRRRQFATALRAARLAVKVALPGAKAGLTVTGVQQAAFQPESPMPPGEGRRWAAHVMPLQITYIQPLK